MDKETLSNYGWIVICVLVLAVMIALATPFGQFISDAVWSTANGLFDVNESALNSTGLIDTNKPNVPQEPIVLETTEFKDGYYTQTGVKDFVFSTLSIQTVDVTPGTIVKFKVWKYPLNNAGAFVGATTDIYYRIDRMKYNVIDAEQGIIEVLVPQDATKLRINVLTEEKETSQIIQRPNDGSIVMPASVALNHGNSISQKYDLTGKNVLWLGDSITYGVGASPQSNRYTDKFQELSGCINENKAVSGAYLTTGSGSTIMQQITSYSGNCDVIIVSAGINDYNFGRTVGTMSDTSDDTMYGALKNLCAHIETNYPDADVIFITPISSEYLTADKITTHINAYRNAISDVALSFGFDVVDGSQLGFSEKQGELSDKYQGDGLHPNTAGHEMMANNLYNILCQ